MRKLTDCNTGHSPNQADEQRLAITQRQIMPVGIFAPYRPDASSDVLRREARCTKCGRKGAAPRVGR
jgi:hypothetical protein